VQQLLSSVCQPGLRSPFAIHSSGLISRAAARQGSSTLSSMWTMTRNEPEIEALSPTGLALTELIATVLTTR
jgi:hypothetical protein